MFDILIISVISGLFLSFFIYLSDSIDSEEENIIDLQKYMKYFFLNTIMISLSIYIFSLFYKNDIDSMNINVGIPNF